ncbi:MAG: hypothetical protein ACRYG8_20650 [Janthinobacterium lividum]
MFIDPLCSFSVRAMQQLQPFVASGRVQLVMIPLAVLEHASIGVLVSASVPADTPISRVRHG